ncbi:MAG: hypothetical protein WC789_10585 [Lentisphaeria bacterium]
MVFTQRIHIRDGAEPGGNIVPPVGRTGRPLSGMQVMISPHGDDHILVLVFSYGDEYKPGDQMAHLVFPLPKE